MGIMSEGTTRGSSRHQGMLGATALALAVLSQAGAAGAYGVEIPENGTVAFGRGGAFLTRASDASAVMHNIAGISGISGPRLHLSIGSNLGSYSHCFQRSGNYDDGLATTLNVDGTRFDPNPNEPNSEPRYATRPTPYPEICNEPRVALAPMILGTYRINNRLSLGFGVFAPSTQGSGQNFPDVVTATNDRGESFEAPSPARNLLFRKNLLVLYPTIGASYQINNWLRVGASLHVGFASFNFGLHANANRTAPQSPSTETLIDLSAMGLLLGTSVGFQALPLPNLSFGANFRYTMPVNASGTANTTFNPYAATEAGRVQGSFDINKMRVELPWNLRASVRYNHPRAGRPRQNDGSGQYDPMMDDVFNVEATFIYENTSSLSTTSLENTGGINTGAALGVVPAPQALTISSALNNVMGVRIGGDVNVIPGRLALRAGFSMESRGASPDLAQIHLPAYSGFSLHGGATYRFSQRLAINVGFGHFFFDNNNASEARRAVTVPSPQLDPNNCPMGVGDGTCRINQGVYRASFTAGSLGFNLAF